MSHTLRLFERIINHRLRIIVELGNIHFVFRRERTSMDLVVAIQFLHETYKDKQQELHHIVSVDVEKVLLSPPIFDTEHQPMIDIPEGCVNVIPDMYRGSVTRVKIMWKDRVL